MEKVIVFGRGRYYLSKKEELKGQRMRRIILRHTGEKLEMKLK